MWRVSSKSRQALYRSGTVRPLKLIFLGMKKQSMFGGKQSTWAALLGGLAFLLLASPVLAQGGNIGEGPGWGRLFLELAGGTILLPGLLSTVALLLLARGRTVRGRRWALAGCFMLPVPFGLLSAFVALIVKSFVLYVVMLLVFQALYVALIGRAWRKVRG